MLPYIQTADQSLSKIQTTWASQINPVLTNQIIQGRLLTNVSVIDTGISSINHGLGRKLVGWMVVGTPGNTPVIIYDNQSLNPRPELTLDLTNLSGLGTALVNLWVF